MTTGAFVGHVGFNAGWVPPMLAPSQTLAKPEARRREGAGRCDSTRWLGRRGRRRVAALPSSSLEAQGWRQAVHGGHCRPDEGKHL